MVNFYYNSWNLVFGSVEKSDWMRRGNQHCKNKTEKTDIYCVTRGYIIKQLGNVVVMKSPSGDTDTTMFVCWCQEIITHTVTGLEISNETGWETVSQLMLKSGCQLWSEHSNNFKLRSNVNPWTVVQDTAWKPLWTKEKQIRYLVPFLNLS